MLAKYPSKVDVYNDIDKEIYNLFKVAREHGDALKTSLMLTPYSRLEYENCRVPSEDKIEQARRTIVKSYMGIGDSIHKSTGFRNSTSSNSSPAKTFKSYVEYMDVFCSRLQSVFLENLDFRECIKKYDRPETFFYCDPPYVHSTRKTKDSYGHEMTNKDHKDLVELLQNLKGSFLLSGYKNSIYPKEWAIIKKTTETQQSKRIEYLYHK